jgi:hypothetical protein
MFMFGYAEYVTVSDTLNHCDKCIRIVLGTVMSFLIICRLDCLALPD